MELTKLYPRLLSGLICSPQLSIQTLFPLQVISILKLSLLHKGFLSDLFGSDYPSQIQRIQVSWFIWSYLTNQRFLIQSTATATLISTTYLWPSANWFERELWEMFGIKSVGHPDLRRLLTDYGFPGHPLRKDFPTSGYSEVRYSERSKRVILKPVFFTQEFRVFDFLSPWQK